MSAEIETLHRPFLQWATTQSAFAVTYHRPDQATGATPGDADVACYARGRVLFIEFKDKETRVSKAQKKRHAELAAVGCTVHIVRSLDAAIALTTEWFSTLGAPVALPAHDGPAGGAVGLSTPHMVIYCDGERGDYVFSRGVRLRRATIDDLRTIPRA